MKQQELEELMQQSAQDAVNTAKEELQINLDYSIDSIDSVDSVIYKIREKYPDQALEDKAVFTICNIYGAYLGEVFKKAVTGGNWKYDESDTNAPSIYMQHGDYTFAFAGVCFEKLVRDIEISVADYFKSAVANANSNS